MNTTTLAELALNPTPDYIVEWSISEPPKLGQHEQKDILCGCGRGIPYHVMQQVSRYEDRTQTPLPYKVRCRGCGDTLSIRDAMTLPQSF